jgi:hypothetical protein
VRNNPASGPLLPDTALVSAIAGHELKNVAQTMQGFVELTTHAGPLSEPVERCFQELRIGIARITALAGELESLANPSGALQRIAIGTLAHDSQWHCDPTRNVIVDPYHARAAIHALMRLARKPRQPASAGLLTVSDEVADTAPCAACGASWSGAVPHLRLQVEARVSRPETRYPDHTARTLTLAVLMHSAHRAGGHVEIDEAAQLLKLTLACD